MGCWRRVPVQASVDHLPSSHRYNSDGDEGGQGPHCVRHRGLGDVEWSYQDLVVTSKEGLLLKAFPRKREILEAVLLSPGGACRPRQVL